MAKFPKNHKNKSNRPRRSNHSDRPNRSSRPSQSSHSDNFNHSSKPKGQNAWNSIAKRYSGMVGTEGSRYHQTLAFPYTLKLLGIKEGDKILDVGCGSGVFCKYVVERKADYTGLDISKKMIAEAKKEFAQIGRFFDMDILKTQPRGEFKPDTFDGVTFILSIQDMPELSKTIAAAAKFLKKDGKMVLFIKHPAFNIPRQSGWIEDEQRSLTSRRVDRYLTPLDMPLMNKFGKKTVTTFHHHNAIQDYVKALIRNNLSIYAFEEIADVNLKNKKTAEFPLFLAIGAKKG